MERLDVLVVGAGPAGVAAALEATARGASVAVIDQAHFPRDKTCGDGLTTSALRLLEALGVDVPGLGAYLPIHDAVITAPGGRHIDLPLPRGAQYAGVIPRRDLDRALVAHARDRGVDLREGEAVEAIEPAVDHVRVRTTTADVSARYVIAADGHYSTVRRLLHPDDPRDLGTWHAFRQYFDGVSTDRLWVFFEPDLLPGYAWLFPLPGGRANVGLGVLRDGTTSGKDLHRRWAELLERPVVRAALGPDAHAVGTPRAWPIPCAYDPDRLTDGRVLYAGDAAAVVDSLTGEGVGPALETGRLAVAALLSSAGKPRPDPATVADRYRHAVHRTIGRDLRFAVALQAVLRSPRLARAAFALVDANRWTRRNVARWMFEDYPRATLVTPDRWRRVARTPGGAFRPSGTEVPTSGR